MKTWRYGWLVVVLLAVAPSLARAADDDSFIEKSREAREEMRATAKKIYEAQMQQRAIRAALAQRKQYDRFVYEEISINEVPVRVLLDRIRAEARRYDIEGKGFNIVYACKPESLKTPVDVDFRNIPLTSLLRYVGLAANLDFAYEPNAIIVRDRGPGAAADGEQLDAHKLLEQAQESR